ncbi:MAG TPA: hypothetical protein VFC76_04995, partial [Oscillospiraceae bacterium]|nr:hypothetical protein [Oscillospiraceae bacterium]
AGGTIVANTNGSGGGEDNTKKDTDVIVPDDTTAAIDDTQSSGTADPTNTGGNTSTTKPQGTAQKSKADIAKLYNDALNKTKAYKGDVKVKRVEGVTTTVTKLALVKSIAQSMLPNTYPETREGTFKNGVATADARTKKGEEKKDRDPGAKLAEYIPPPEGKSAKLSAAGIKDAKYTAVGSGYKLEITLVQEAGDGINYVPPYHSSVMDTLAMSDEELKPFSVINATTTYSGATITMQVNSNGLVTSLSILEIVNVTGKVTYGNSSQGLEAILDGEWKQDITFTY